MTDITDQTSNTTDISPVTVEEEMRTSYLAYAMSVIVSRALPDVRDGLKPVHRRILYAMQESGFTHDKPYRKSARAVGDVMGKYHPHGDSSIYDAMVRMAQPWSMRVQLIDGQGNFGSIDNDPPAAMRYTEARLAKITNFLLDDIDRDTVDFQPNYDETEKEPVVLPAAFPNLLVNGTTGIAVGMATNIPPHNPVEVVDGSLALVKNPDLSDEELLSIVPGPDFPTGGIILGRQGIQKAYATGRGSIIIRARAEIEEVRKDRQAIVVTEIPYQVNKAVLHQRITELGVKKEVEGIAAVRDESDRSGMRLVIEIKRDATPEIVLNQLYRYTQLQTSFGVNLLALDGGRPRLMGLRDVLEAFLAFREEVILRRSLYDLNKLRDRGHILIGLVIAVANIEDVIAMIRSAPDTVAARQALMEASWEAGEIVPLLNLISDEGNVVKDGKIHLTEAQARGILELRLQRLTGLEREKIQNELVNDVAPGIQALLEIIQSRPRRLEVLCEELEKAREALKSSRLTEIADYAGDQDDEDLIEPGQMVVTITREGYIKRTPLDVFRAQNRGGRGRNSAAIRENDIIVRSFTAHTHQWVLFFTSGGQVYRQKVWRLPETGPASKGRALVNLLPSLQNDTVTTVLPLPLEEETWEGLHLVFATAKGYVRRNRLSDFRNIRASGLIAMKLQNDDYLIGVETCSEGQDVFLATHNARCIRFQITDRNLRVFAGRGSQGVRGIKLAPNDYVISLSILNHVDVSSEERHSYLRQKSLLRRRENALEETSDETMALEEEDFSHPGIELSPERYTQLQDGEQLLLTVSDDGFGRLSSSYDFRVSGRGVAGVTNMRFSQRRGKRNVSATLPVLLGTDVILVTDQGRLIRLPVDQIRIAARPASGVTLFRLNKGERVKSVFPVEGNADEDNDATEE